jgi:glycerol-3-phosphate O-acyltransferase
MAFLRSALPYDAPLFRFNEERPHLKAEVARRIYSDYLTASRKSQDARLEYVLNETAYVEIDRLRTETGPEEEIRDMGWWRHLARTVGEISEDEKREILRTLVDSYVEDTAGKFDPEVFSFATSLLPMGLGVLFKTQDLRDWGLDPRVLREGLSHLRDLSERVVVEGHTATMRKLVQRGTMVVVPTHSSNMDSILMGWSLHHSGLPPVTYGAGKNLFTNPLTSFFMHNLGAYKVDRRLSHQLYKDILKTYSQVLLERGYHSLFFPGGTRCRSNMVEQKLKLGLLGTAVTAYTNNLIQTGKDERIYICPVTINYNLVLEAESLIREFLRREGGARYFLENDEFNQLKTVIRFVLNTMKMDSTTVIRYGEPMDPFGNVVDADGESYDDRGRRVDPKTYIQSSRTGDVVVDDSRDRQYTRFTGKKVADSFLRNTVIQPAQVVAWAIFELVRDRFPKFDVYQLLRMTDDEIVPWHELRATVAELVSELRELAGRDQLRLAPVVASAEIDETIDDGIDSLRTFHIPSQISISGSGVRARRLDLLYFYGNRVRTYDVDAAELLARAKV